MRWLSLCLLCVALGSLPGAAQTTPALDPSTEAAIQALIQALVNQAKMATSPLSNPAPAAPAVPAKPAAPAPAASTPAFPANVVLLGAVYSTAPVGTPNFNAVGSYGKWINSTLGYSLTSYDAYFVKVAGKIQIVKAERTGLAPYVKTVGPAQIFGYIDAGTAQTTSSSGVNVGNSFSGGGFAAIRIGNSGAGFTIGARFVKSNVASGSATATVIEVAPLFGWGK